MYDNIKSKIGALIMDKKTVEKMKKLIEEKKSKGAKGNNLRPQKTIGHKMKGKKSSNGGGLFDK